MSGAVGGALVILAILIGIYIGKAKKNLDDDLKQREKGITITWSTLKDAPKV